MNDDVLTFIYLLLILFLIVPGFLYANKNKKTFLKILIIWIGIVGIIFVLLNL